MLQREACRQAAADLAEVDAQTIELLPRRAALGGLIDITTVVPVNIAIAVNAATFHSTASAHALQGAFVH